MTSAYLYFYKQLQSHIFLHPKISGEHATPGQKNRTHLQIHILMVKPQWIHVNTIFDQKHRSASFSRQQHQNIKTTREGRLHRGALQVDPSPAGRAALRAARAAPPRRARGRGAAAHGGDGGARLAPRGAGRWPWRQWLGGEMVFRMGLLYFYFSYYKNEIQYSRMIIMMIMYIWEWYNNNNNNITIIITIIITIAIITIVITTIIIIWYKSSGYAGSIPFRFVVPVQFRSAAFKSVDNMATWRCNLFICISGGDQKRTFQSCS